MNWKKELRDWRNWFVLGASSFGTIIWFISWIMNKPEIQQVLRGIRI